MAKWGRQSKHVSKLSLFATRITTVNYLVSPVLIESSLSWKATETSPSSWNFGSLTLVRLFNQADELKCLDIRGLVWTLNLDLCLIFQQALTATCMKCPQKGSKICSCDVRWSYSRQSSPYNCSFVCPKATLAPLEGSHV